MAIPAVLSLVYMRCVRRRIAFAAAHLQCACDALSAPGGAPIFAAAVSMLLVQCLWNGLWGLAALGLNAKLSANSTSAGGLSLALPQQGRLLAPLEASPSASSSASDSAGAYAMFALLISFYWGAQVFSNVVHFVTATVVGEWWLGPPPGAPKRSPVWLGMRRAFTTSFGTIAFGSLIVAVLRALEQLARGAERNARREGKPAAVFAAACLLCLVAWARKATEYL